MVEWKSPGDPYFRRLSLPGLRAYSTDQVYSLSRGEPELKEYRMLTIRLKVPYRIVAIIDRLLDFMRKHLGDRLDIQDSLKPLIEWEGPPDKLLLDICKRIPYSIEEVRPWYEYWKKHGVPNEALWRAITVLSESAMRVGVSFDTLASKLYAIQEKIRDEDKKARQDGA
jgi:hypothetical protein